MSLHRLTSLTIGVPNVKETVDYYTDFGLELRTSDPATDRYVFATQDGGQQLELVHTPRRRLVQMGVGVHDQDDLDRVTASLRGLGLEAERAPGSVRVADPHSELKVRLEIAPEVVSKPVPPEPTNGPGRMDRPNGRAPGVERTGRVRPRKLGHLVIGAMNQEAAMRFFTDGLGFKVSDHIAGRASFLRCSSDHHNILIQQTPINFLHHTAWEVEDVDEVGRGAYAMLEDHPDRHIWGLGRHHIGSNFFWYLKDPAGNFSEYYSDMDCIVEDALWHPEAVEGARGLYNWGPPPPPSFMAPDDLAELMTGSHSIP